MAGFEIDAAHLIGIFLGLLIYGFYLAVFVAMGMHLRRRARDSKIVVSAMLALFLFSTSYYALATWDIYLAFITMRENPGVVAYLNDYGDNIAAAKDALYMLSLLVADSLLVWRLFVIWPENRLAKVVVIILMLAVAVCGFFTGVLEIRQAIVADDRFVDRVYHWTIAGSALVICNNILVTGCIAGRLLWMSRVVAVFGQKSKSLYQRIVYVMIQSGALYLTVVLLQVVLYAVGVRAAIYLFLHISPAVVALFPTAIILQLISEPAPVATMATAHQPTISQWAVAWPDQGGDSGGSDTLTGIPALPQVGQTTTIRHSLHDIEAGLPDSKPPSITWEGRPPPGDLQNVPSKEG